jgi:hypothetical protein
MIIPFLSYRVVFLPISSSLFQNNEINKLFHELLEVSVIHPSTRPYASHVVMVLKKEGTWHMFPDFHSLHKLTIKGIFPILG